MNKSVESMPQIQDAGNETKGDAQITGHSIIDHAMTRLDTKEKSAVFKGFTAEDKEKIIAGGASNIRVKGGVTQIEFKSNTENRREDGSKGRPGFGGIEEIQHEEVMSVQVIHAKTEKETIITVNRKDGSSYRIISSAA